MGLSPNDLVLGASNAVGLNDGAVIRAKPFSGSTTLGDMAALGVNSPNLSGAGVGSAFRYVWSIPSLQLRQSSLTAYRTSGTVTAQAGTTFLEPAENRAGVPIRQDPLWTWTVTGPTTGTPIFVTANQSKTLLPGNYGPTTVYSGGTLILQIQGSFLDPVNYGFVSLDLEPGAKVQMTNAANSTVTVTSSLIFRAPLGGLGTVLAYLGSGSIDVEAPFTGDLFLAPNASVSVKADSTGHFFAKNVTVFERHTVTAQPLTTNGRLLVMPAEQVSTLGEPMSNAIEGEIATAVLNPTPMGCTAPTLFLSNHGNSVFGSPFDASGTVFAGTPFSAPLADPSGPSSCIGTPLPGGTGRVPPGVDPNAHPWQILPGGVRSYTQQGVFTDNVITRVGDGTVAFMGQAYRVCEDPSTGVPQGPGCPATQPTPGQSCNAATVPGACVYGATPGTQCSCLTEGTPPTTTFVCGPLKRVEEGVLNLNVSHDCGAHWTATPLDFFDLGVQVSPPPVTARDFDRPEFYYDPFDQMLYISSVVGKGPGTGPTGLAIFSSPAANLTSASQLHFSLLRNDPRVEPNATDATIPPRVMTTTLDEAAISASGSQTRRVDLATFRCAGNIPRLDVDTAFGVKTFDLTDGTDKTTLCENVPLGGDLAPNLWHGPSIVGTASWPPRLYIAYTGRNASNMEIINLYVVTLRSAQNYAATPIITRLATIDRSDIDKHVLFPQLIRADGAGGSDPTRDSPLVLRYASWDAGDLDTVEELEQGLYSGMLAPVHVIATWKVSAAMGNTPGSICPLPGTTDRCFTGDYRYGTFYRKQSGALTFFTPWTGQSSTSGTTGIYAQGATMTITP
jgi:hypothetical protein